MRPLLRSVRWVEHSFSSLLACGFSHNHAIRAYKAFTSFVLGVLLLDAASRGAQMAPSMPADVSQQRLIRPRTTPTVAELADLLAADRADFEFVEGFKYLN